MELQVVNTGFFKLDGGAMFGVVPKSIWQKTNPSDENNLCTWSMRCLLFRDGNNQILIDNGIGNKQDQNFFKFFHLHGNDSLTRSLQNLGTDVSEITDNLLTHLHFDHCGGGTFYKEDRSKILPVFTNANYWIHSAQLEWALQPNVREKASFLQENILPMKESGQLTFTDKKEFPAKNISFLFVDGHTEKQTIPIINYKGRTVVFAADLLPSVGHIPLPYVMGYDTRPLLTLKEKEAFLKKAAKEEYILFLEHDPVNECCTVQETDRGVRVKDVFDLRDIA